MTPALLAAIVSLVEEAIAQEPTIVASLQNIFSKPNPTPEDWQALRLQILNAEAPIVETAANVVPLPPAAAPAAPDLAAPPVAPTAVPPPPQPLKVVSIGNVRTAHNAPDSIGDVVVTDGKSNFIVRDFFFPTKTPPTSFLVGAEISQSDLQPIA